MGKKKSQAETNQQKQHYEAFFSGLPYESTEQDLKQFLGTTDGILSIKMPRYQDTARCLGYAHVKFENSESYENALSKNGNNLGGRYLTIQAAKGEKQSQAPPPSIPVGCKTLFVKGLPYQITQEQLKKQFGTVGGIKDIRMVRNWANRNFKGFAYIEYKQGSSLKKAVSKYHNKLYEGRRLICDASMTLMKKGYKKRDENPKNEQQQQVEQ